MTLWEAHMRDIPTIVKRAARKRGRPSEGNMLNVFERITIGTKNGFSIKNIASLLGVSTQYLYEVKKKFTN